VTVAERTFFTQPMNQRDWVSKQRCQACRAASSYGAWRSWRLQSPTCGCVM
jgi:hypothetical protein